MRAISCQPKRNPLDCIKSKSSTCSIAGRNSFTYLREVGFGSGAEELRWSTTRPLCPDEQTLGPTVGFVSYGSIALQKSQNAVRIIFREKTKQATIADQCSLKLVTGIAREFDARRRSPPHNYSIATPTARKICLQ